MTRSTTNSTLPPQGAFHHAILRHLAQHPDGFDKETRRRVIREGRSQIQGEEAAGDSSTGIGEVTVQHAPDERIDTALEEIHRSVAQELLDKIAQAP